MNIEEFYDDDPRRRASAEVEFGENWRDQNTIRYELSWIQDTGELYAMVEAEKANGVRWATPFGGVHVIHAHSVDEKEVEAMEVIVVGSYPDRGILENLIEGWENEITKPGSVHWLAQRLGDGVPG